MNEITLNYENLFYKATITDLNDETKKITFSTLYSDEATMLLDVGIRNECEITISSDGEIPED